MGRMKTCAAKRRRMKSLKPGAEGREPDGGSSDGPDRRRRIGQRSAYLYCEARPLVEDDVVTGEGLEDGDQAEEHPGHPDHLVPDLEPPAEVLVV